MFVFHETSIFYAEGIAVKSVSTTNFQPELRREYLGTYKITYYCGCEKCCGKTDKITSSGRLAKEGVTIAADNTLIQQGSQVYIQGIGLRTVDDCGGAIKGRRIDVFIESHQKALELGVDYCKVFRLEEVE